MPVPCFLLFLCFRKVTQEIFSELDNSKAEVPIFPDTSTESKAETEEGAEVATPPLGAGPPLAAPAWCVGPLWPPSYSPSDLWKLPGKIRLQELVSSNSKNISCVSLLKHKNSRKQGTGTVATC